MPGKHTYVRVMLVKADQRQHLFLTERGVYLLPPVPENVILLEQKEKVF